MSCPCLYLSVTFLFFDALTLLRYDTERSMYAKNLTAIEIVTVPHRNKPQQEINERYAYSLT